MVSMIGSYYLLERVLQVLHSEIQLCNLCGVVDPHLGNLIV